MTLQKQDIRHYSDQELSLRVMNEQGLYHLMQKAVRWNNFEALLDLLNLCFLYSDAQLEDLVKTYEAEVLEYLSTINMNMFKSGDLFKVLRTHYQSNPYYHIKLITGSNTRNPSGTGSIPLEVGQVLTFDRSNFWDCSFWSINGVTGKIECTPDGLLEDGVITRI